MYNLVIAIAVLSIFFLVFLKNRDPSIVDVAFTISLILMSISSYTLIDEKTAASHLFLVMSIIWGVRLAVLLVQRYRYGQKDLRYDSLKLSFSDKQTQKFFLFFLFQGVAAFLLSINFIVAYHYQYTVGLWQVVAFVLFLVFLGMEVWADYQMFQYRKSHHGKPGVLKEGLWRYSRHPNYFFEVLVWCTFALFSSSGWHAIFGWAAVALLLFFILKVTGIPATEELLVKTKGDAYRQYQRTTSAFFPWFPKS
jgi:steroid 5-alpha reductase family enzyme